MAIKKGDTVKVEYTGTLDDGTQFDASSNLGRPLEFKVGEGSVIKGFEEGVVGMNVGEEKKIHLTPAHAYGDVNPLLVKKVPRGQLPKEQEPQKGMMLLINLPNGVQLPAKIVEVTAADVTLDLNHPLAGKNLNFKIKVVSVEA
ncbi:peptidylprolyl isomerase [Candidatus Woesearchaeota archaeon]|nr:peptidylprolyl isomerase [Candidatus Woesearchaeota archaeon]